MEAIYKHYVKHMIMVVIITRNKTKNSLTTLLIIFESYKVLYHHEYQSKLMDQLSSHFLLSLILSLKSVLKVPSVLSAP
jgi:hypothetical protein